MSILLIILTVIFGLTAPLNLWVGSVESQHGDTQSARGFYGGAVWNAIVALLCLAAWRLMQCQSRVFFAASGCMVAGALFIVMRTWLVALLRGRNPFPVIEAVLTWLPMLYAIIYAHLASQREGAA